MTTSTPESVRTYIADVVEEARSRTNMHDFGGDSWREGMEILIRSALHHSEFTELGTYMFREAVVRPLVNRLRIEDWYRRHPEIDEQDVTVELCGLGFPRTGSTALGALLGEDSRYRFLRRWEAPNPCPPAGVSAADDEARVAHAGHEIALLNEALSIDLLSLLPSSPTGPTEDLDLMELEFTAGTFTVAAYAPEYAQWYFDHDMESSYRYEMRALKLLQWKTPQKIWRLRSPMHTLFVDAYAKVFPEARFVQTHRHMRDVLPSISDMYYTFLSAGVRGIDPVWVGELNVHQWSLALGRVLEFRSDSAQDAKFFDMGFRSFQADQIGEIERLYAWLGDELSEDAVERMRVWQRDNAMDKHAKPCYNAAKYGLDDAAMTTAFKAYHERFASYI